jgi:hypothetical protein
MSVCLTASASRLAALAGALLVGLSSLPGCVDTRAGTDPRVYLDQSTAATVTTVGRPLVFAHERPNFAVHMRDYITLAAASVDRAGKLESILIAYYWTTFDPHGQDGETAAKTRAGRSPDELTLVADDRRIRMVKLERTAHEVGIEERAHAPSVGGGVPTIYSIDLSTMRYIAAARNLSAQTRTGETVLDYEMWEDGRPALAQWLHHLAE